MLDALKFVRGAVAKKDFQPVLTHFRIARGRVLGYNGMIALSSPIDLDIDAVPRADQFVRAVERCEEGTTVVHMTESGRLALRSGKFRAYIDCHDEPGLLDSVQPEGQSIVFPGSVLGAFKALYPFVSDDASRPVYNGVLLRDFSAFATNNIVLVQHWLGVDVPEVNIPAMALKEIIRIGEEPVFAQIGANNITFYFEGDRWLRTQLLSTDWTPMIAKILDLPCNPKPFPAELFDAVETLTPFVEGDGRVYFRSDRVTTCAGGEGGASVELHGLPASGAFHYKHLLSLRGVAESIDFDPYPNPCGFRGRGG
jgi:hypothetical protein